MKRAFVDWLEGVFEDDPLDEEIHFLDFILEGKKPRINLSFMGSEDGLFPLYYPLEAQSFFNVPFFNLQLSPKEVFKLVEDMLTYCFEQERIKRMLNPKMVIRLGFKGKKWQFLKQLG